MKEMQIVNHRHNKRSKTFQASKNKTEESIITNWNAVIKVELSTVAYLIQFLSIKPIKTMYSKAISLIGTFFSLCVLFADIVIRNTRRYQTAKFYVAMN